MTEASNESRPTPSEVTASTTKSTHDVHNRIVKKFGGRHLIFRTTPNSMRILPRPYVLVSSFRGPIWVFYGLGQVWLTHKKLHEFAGWMARAPRLRSREVTAITEELGPDLESFINYCNESGIEGTILIEKKVIEFHWTFGFELEKEKLKVENADTLETRFQELVARYLQIKDKLNL